MNIKRIPFLSLLTAVNLVRPLGAQVVDDSATNTFNNVTNAITGVVTVGTNGAFTLLVLSDNALLTNSAHGVIGANATARSNQVHLVSPSARWLMGGNLFVGSNGASSTLVVSNGALVANNQGVAGFLASGSNNAVLVTGAGSVWSNRQSVYVGQNAGFNRVRVTEGAQVFSTTLDLGFSSTFASDNEVTVTGPNSTWSSGGNGIVRVGNGSSRNLLRVSNGGTVIAEGIGYIGTSTAASSNTALVTDAGSRWLVGTNLFVGLQGALNRLVISNGGAVFSASGNLGSLSTSDDNLAIVTGTGSLWSNTNNLSVGVAGARNRLIITNGGAVSGSNIVVGFDSASFANRVTVDGGTLQVASASGAGALDVRRGTNVLNAGLVDVDRLVLTNAAAGVFEFKGGTLITRGTLSGSGMVVSGSGTNPAVWDVRPGVSGHMLGQGVVVGNASSFNQLLVSGGAVLSNNIVGYVGLGPGANSNSASVSGAGSRWQVAGEVAAGAGGAFNRLMVSDGAAVGGTSGRVGGAQFASSNNVAMVTGPGSVWNNTNSLLVGDASPGNQLLVSDGALVSNQAGTVGNSSSSSNNVAVVTGAGSVWSNATSLQIGLSGAGTQFVVSNSGRVVASLLVDIGGFSENNQAVVTGPESVLGTGGFGLTVGVFGGGNRLSVKNGGLVSGDFGYVGLGSDSNAVTVTGATSRWSNRLDQIVGNDASRNELTISDGGTAFVGGDGIIGDFPAAMSNTVVVSDPGSRWLVTSNLNVGDQGSFNRLVVSNGGFVNASSGRLGAAESSSNNTVVVTDAGSMWSNTISLVVGGSGSGNRLVVSNGGLVVSAVALVGSAAISENNSVLVAGPGTSWRVAGTFNIGNRGLSNRLDIVSGAQVTNRFGRIGREGRNHEVTVTGAGSTWDTEQDLSVGDGGARNRLVINSGGAVSGSNVFVGIGPDSTNNRVLVNGGTLRAANPTGTGVLDVRRGTNVLNAGLIEVDHLILTNKGMTPTALRFGNSGSNNIPGFGLAAPSTVTVTGLAGAITRVAVTLSNLSHTVPDDLDILLVGPAGQKVMLMSDAGGLNDITDLRLAFDDAGMLLPDANTLVAATYRPTDYESGQSLSSPAPPGPYSTSLSSFNGSSPNGVWTLYIDDDNFSGGIGYLRGWGLQFFTDSSFIDSGTFEFNGGTLITRGAIISNTQPFVLGGPGGVPAVWKLLAGPNNQLVAGDVIMGSLTAGSSNNVLHVSGGTLQASCLDIRSGTNRLDAGLLEVGRLIVTNARGQVELNGGTLRTPDTTIANGRLFTVGNGPGPATLQLLGGTHTFANNLTVASNGSLIGNGTVDGTVTVAPGGRLTPGAPIGHIDVLGTVILQGAANLQIDKSGGMRTNDQVTASGAIFYSGTLNVTDIGTDLLAAGDRFPLFNAAPYVGAFATLNLPPLGPGLSWANNLSVDGSIAVIAASQPGFASIRLSGTNVIVAGTNGTPNSTYTVLAATNVALPLANWTSLATNPFSPSGTFSFTNAIVPDIPQRYFRLRTP